MDDIGVGRLIRLARQRRNWRQMDLAHAAGVAITEIKTRMYDLQGLASGVDRKARLGAMLLPAERGWSPVAVGRLVVVPELMSNRNLVRDHTSLFAAAFPARSRAVRAWLREPSGPIAGLWFLSIANVVGTNQIAVGRQRVRQRRKAGRHAGNVA